MFRGEERRRRERCRGPGWRSLGRPALDALQTVEALRARGVGLVMLDPGGEVSGDGLSKPFSTIAAAFVEAERDRIGERVVQV